MMLGWFSAEAARASCSNRCLREASVEIEAGRTSIATSRPSRVSRAFHTSPIPPAPIGERTSYGPMRLPAAIVTSFREDPMSSEALAKEDRTGRGGFRRKSSPDDWDESRLRDFPVACQQRQRQAPRRGADQCVERIIVWAGLVRKEDLLDGQV